jgi:hypothetical protein
MRKKVYRDRIISIFVIYKKTYWTWVSKANLGILIIKIEKYTLVWAKIPTSQKLHSEKTSSYIYLGYQ